MLEMNAAGTVTAVNTWGPTGLLARRSGGASVFYTFDSQGNVAQRLDGSGAVLSSHLYDAWGNEITTPVAGEPFGYGGQSGYYTDRETGLQLLGFRYYDPAAGRFLTRDPSGYAGGANLYAYALNSPVDLVDPLARIMHGLQCGAEIL